MGIVMVNAAILLDLSAAEVAMTSARARPATRPAARSAAAGQARSLCSPTADPARRLAPA